MGHDPLLKISIEEKALLVHDGIAVFFVTGQRTFFESKILSIIFRDQINGKSDMLYHLPIQNHRLGGSMN